MEDPTKLESEEKQLTQPVTVYTGWKRLADAKVRFGQWLEDRRTDD